eukprot:9188910-Pyramimonas_sp.AAC.1
MNLDVDRSKRYKAHILKHARVRNISENDERPATADYDARCVAATTVSPRRRSACLESLAVSRAFRLRANLTRKSPRVNLTPTDPRIDSGEGEQVRQVLEGVWQGDQVGHHRGQPEPHPPVQAAALHHLQVGRQAGEPGGVRGAHAGGPEADLLPGGQLAGG